MVADNYSNRDYWRAIILYGLNNATYKIALGKSFSIQPNAVRSRRVADLIKAT